MEISANGARRLPCWEELPDLDIYMDQVISLIGRYLTGFAVSDEKGLTPSMVNNYVKSGIIPPPVKKKYERTHLAYLIMICILKTVMPISRAGELIRSRISSGMSCSELYASFCAQFDEAEAAAAEKTEKMSVSGSDVYEAIFYAALFSHAEQETAMNLMRSAGIGKGSDSSKKSRKGGSQAEKEADADS